MKRTNSHPAKPGLKVISLGCPKNLVDTEKILGALATHFVLVEELNQAQLVLINTCSFIQPAIEESLENICEVIASTRHLSPKPKIVLTGCLVNRYFQEIKQEFPEVDLILPIAEQKNIYHHLKTFFPELRTSQQRLITTHAYAYLKISEGCNNRCSFCTIPRIRGKLKSVPQELVLQEAKELEKAKIKEVVIVAQDSTSYGKDLGYKDGLITLLHKLSEFDFQWIRLLYLYPSGIDKNLLQIIKNNPKILPYFDLPLQHSHPDILQQMGRPFKKDPQLIINQIREILPQASLRTTFIVGFPGETSKHFEHLVHFVEKNRFNHLGVFTFFKEEGTRAAKLERQVSAQEKIKRKQIIMQLQSKISAQILKQWEGKSLEVIIDRKNPEWPTLFEGRAWFQAPEIDGLTYVSGENIKVGEFYQAQIEETKVYDLVGLV